VVFEPAPQRGTGGLYGRFDSSQVGGDELGCGFTFIERAFEGETGLGDGPNAKRCTRRCQAVSGSAEKPQIRTCIPKGIKAGRQASEVAVDYSTQHGGVAPEGDVQLVEDAVVNGGGHRD
jgi:hypothetical protein